jgi:hypothetical protein
VSSNEMIFKPGSSFDDSEDSWEEHDRHNYTIKLLLAFNNENNGLRMALTVLAPLFVHCFRKVKKVKLFLSFIN